jgi:hypothetical protein
MRLVTERHLPFGDVSYFISEQPEIPLNYKHELQLPKPTALHKIQAGTLFAAV